MYRECHSIALAQRNDVWPRLHARPLLGEHELATGEIPPWLAEQDSYLDRENVLAIEILVQTVEIAGAVLQQ
jgi:hypothetical protein